MKKILTVLIAISLLAPQLSFAARPSYMAITTSTDSAITKNNAKQEQIAQNSADKLSKGIARGDKEIDRRITSLNELLTKIDSMKKLSASNKTIFASEIQTEIDSLNSLKAKIDADTDITTLRTDLQSIVKEYRVYVLYIPKMRILVAADRLGVAADTLASYSANLSAKVNEAETAGQDMTEEKKLLTDMNSKISDAKQMYQQAVDLVTPLTPDLWPNSKTTLQNAQADIKEGAKDLRSAFNDAVSIRKTLVGKSDLEHPASGSSNIKISPLKK